MLEGAHFAEGAIQLSEDLHAKLPASRLKWRQKSSRAPAAQCVEFPLYLNHSRTTLLSDVLLAVPAKVPAHVWAQRGVAVIMQSSL